MLCVGSWFAKCKPQMCIHNICFNGELRKIFSGSPFHIKNQGPVVQSVLSLTSSLKVILLTVLADSIHNILLLLFFC